MSKKKKLYLFTDRFPYGWSEKTFILPELKWLTLDYDVTVVSSAIREEIEQREMKTDLGDIKEINIEPVDITLRQKIKYTLAALFDGVWWKELSGIIKSRDRIPNRIRSTLGFYAFAKVFWKRFTKKVNTDDPDGVIFYSYWLNYQTFSSLRKKEKNKNIKVVSRVHNVDLFQERNSSGWQPFRKYMGEKLDGLFFVAQEGEEYFVNTFMNGLVPDTFHLCRLGVRKKNNRSPFEPEGEFKLVSCSNVIRIKRVDLIIRALSMLDPRIKINWVHFGSGTGMEEIKKLAHELLDEKENISFRFAGFTPNDEIMNYYENEQVNCFITASELEGCPVSIMEALSCGIPVIATDVGGTAETIENNGILLEKNPDVNTIKKAVEEFFDTPFEKQKMWRDNSFRIWDEKYNEEKNNSRYRELFLRTCS